MGQIGKAVTHMVQAEGESKNECLWMIYHCVQLQQPWLSLPECLQPEIAPYRDLLQSLAQLPSVLCLTNTHGTLRSLPDLSFALCVCPFFIHSLPEPRVPEPNPRG